MPTYEYQCTACGERLEVEQRFTDEPLTTCPKCGGVLRKVFSPVGVVFKGSGFYKTDSRSTPASSSSKSTSDGEASAPAATTTTADKPAAPATPATPSAPAPTASGGDS